MVSDPEMGFAISTAIRSLVQFEPGPDERTGVQPLDHVAVAVVANSTSFVGSPDLRLRHPGEKSPLQALK